MEPTQEQITAIQHLSSRLEGSCSISQESIIEHELECVPLRGIDSDMISAWIYEYGEIFVCDVCGWWCSNSEMSGVDGCVCAECENDA